MLRELATPADAPGVLRDAYRVGLRAGPRAYLAGLRRERQRRLADRYLRG
jgi:hypothetical protein